MSKKTVNTETGEIIDTPDHQWPTNRLHVRHQYNSFQFPEYGEHNKQPSQTIPDQTLPLRTLLDRYAKGLPLSGNNAEPVYYGDEQMPDLQKMDISEIHDLKNAVKSDILKKQEELQTQQHAAKKAAHEKSINDEVEKRINSKESKPKPKPEPEK